MVSNSIGLATEHLIDRVTLLFLPGLAPRLCSLVSKPLQLESLVIRVIELVPVL